MIDVNRWFGGLTGQQPEEEESAVQKTLRMLQGGAETVQQGATNLYNAAAAPMAAGPGYGPQPLPEGQAPWVQTAGPAIQQGATGLYDAAQDATNAVETVKRAGRAGWEAAADAYVPDTLPEAAAAITMPPYHASQVAQAGQEAFLGEIGRGLGRAAGTSTDPIANVPGYGPVSSEDIAAGVAQVALDPTNLVGAGPARAAVRAAPRVATEVAQGAMRAGAGVLDDVGRRAAGVADDLLSPGMAPEGVEYLGSGVIPETGAPRPGWTPPPQIPEEEIRQFRRAAKLVEDGKPLPPDLPVITRPMPAREKGAPPYDLHFFVTSAGEEVVLPPANRGTPGRGIAAAYSDYIAAQGGHRGRPSGRYQSPDGAWTQFDSPQELLFMQDFDSQIARGADPQAEHGGLEAWWRSGESPYPEIESLPYIKTTMKPGERASVSGFEGDYVLRHRDGFVEVVEGKDVKVMPKQEEWFQEPGKKPALAWNVLRKAAAAIPALASQGRGFRMIVGRDSASMVPTVEPSVLTGKGKPVKSFLGVPGVDWRDIPELDRGFPGEGPAVGNQILDVMIETEREARALGARLQAQGVPADEQVAPLTRLVRDRLLPTADLAKRTTGEMRNVQGSVTANIPNWRSKAGRVTQAQIEAEWPAAAAAMRSAEEQGARIRGATVELVQGPNDVAPAPRLFIDTAGDPAASQRLAAHLAQELGADDAAGFWYYDWQGPTVVREMSFAGADDAIQASFDEVQTALRTAGEGLPQLVSRYNTDGSLATMHVLGQDAHGNLIPEDDLDDILHRVRTVLDTFGISTDIGQPQRAVVSNFAAEGGAARAIEQREQQLGLRPLPPPPRGLRGSDNGGGARSGAAAESGGGQAATAVPPEGGRGLGPEAPPGATDLGSGFGGGRPTVEVLQARVGKLQKLVAEAQLNGDQQLADEAMDILARTTSDLADARNARLALEPRIASDVGRRVDNAAQLGPESTDAAMSARYPQEAVRAAPGDFSGPVGVPVDRSRGRLNAGINALLPGGGVRGQLRADAYNAAQGGVFGAASETLEAGAEDRETDFGEQVRRGAIGAGLAVAAGRGVGRRQPGRGLTAAGSLGSGVVPVDPDEIADLARRAAETPKAAPQTHGQRIVRDVSKEIQQQADAGVPPETPDGPMPPPNPPPHWWDHWENWRYNMGLFAQLSTAAVQTIGPVAEALGGGAAEALRLAVIRGQGEALPLIAGGAIQGAGRGLVSAGKTVLGQVPKAIEAGSDYRPSLHAREFAQGNIGRGAAALGVGTPGRIATQAPDAFWYEVFHGAGLQQAAADIARRELGGGGVSFRGLSGGIAGGAAGYESAPEDASPWEKGARTLGGAVLGGGVASAGPAGIARARRMRELVANPTPEMLEAAARYAQDSTFKGTPGGLFNFPRAVGEKVNEAIEWKPAQNALGAVGNFLMPVYNTIARIHERGLEQVPGLGAVPLEKVGLAPKGASRAWDTRAAQQAVGLAFTASALAYAAEGGIRGPGPSNPNEAQAMRDSGYTPNTINIAGYWVPTSWLGSYGPTLNEIGAINDARLYDHGDKGWDDLTWEKKATALVKMSAKAARDYPALDAAATLTKVFSDPVGTLAGFVGEVGAQYVPGPVRTAATWTDPKVRARTKGSDVPAEQVVEETFRQRSGWGKQDLPAAQDILGRDVENPRQGPSSLLPRLGVDKPDPIIQAYLDANLNIGDPAKELTVPGLKDTDLKPELTPEEQRRWNTLRGEAIIRRAGPAIADTRWGERPLENRQALLERHRTAAAEEAHGRLRSEIGAEEIKRRINEARAVKQRRAS